MISSGTARADRTRVGVAVTCGPVGMLSLMARPLVVIAGALVGMAMTLSAGALPPTAETLMVMARAVMARTVRARMLLLVVVIAG
ncbi:hypothetical protein ACQP25_36250 [Microtetraspora malaysiensis]|uniref:hypothetical protein n=1 Tax=Microtetraspora malaysiensis TaxID=161358 RepID=UPI003D926142